MGIINELYLLIRTYLVSRLSLAEAKREMTE